MDLIRETKIMNFLFQEVEGLQVFRLGNRTVRHLLFETYLAEGLCRQ
jgi:hypothetical protein